MYISVLLEGDIDVHSFIRVIGLCLSVCPLIPYSCGNEGLVETLLHNTIVRIQKSLAST